MGYSCPCSRSIHRPCRWVPEQRGQNLFPVLKDLTLDTYLLLLLLLLLQRLLLLSLKGRRETPMPKPLPRLMLILRLTHGCTTAVCMETTDMAMDITMPLSPTPTLPTLTPMCMATMA